jgi:hypothetical protein
MVAATKIKLEENVWEGYSETLVGSDKAMANLTNEVGNFVFRGT